MKITSTSNETVRLLASLCKRNARSETGLFLLDGDKLILEAVKSGLQIVYVLYDKEEKHKDVLQSVMDCPNRMEASPHVLEKISPACSPQGIVAAAAMMEYDIRSISEKGTYVMLDKIQDPGNLGTIFRTCEALGVDGVILSKDSADVYGPKAVRGAMGSSMRLPFFVADDMREMISYLHNLDMTVYASTLSNDSIPVQDIHFGQGSVMLIGNEGNGISDELCNLCDKRVLIPMHGQTESLNASVAAAILIWEMNQKR